MSDQDLEAAKRELESGEPFVWKNADRPFKHMGKVREGQKALLDIIASCKNALGSVNLVPSERQPTMDLLGKASRLLDKSTDFLPRGSSIKFWKSRDEWTSSWSPKDSP